MKKKWLFSERNITKLWSARLSKTTLNRSKLKNWVVEGQILWKDQPLDQVTKESELNQTDFTMPKKNQKFRISPKFIGPIVNPTPN